MIDWRILAAFALAVALAAPACIEYPNCENDDHCKDHSEYCLNGKCAQCRDKSHCSRGFQCVAGACEKIRGWCEDVTDCDGRQKCRENRCGPECLSDTECGSNEECKAGQCQVKPACVVDADCPAGQECRNGNCLGAVADARCDNLEPVYFDFDESALRADARETLRNHVGCIKDKAAPMQLEGHCDSRGTESYNLALGERRARTTKDYLVQLGAARSNLSIISYGESRPAKYGGTESVYQLNRRCEFVWK